MSHRATAILVTTVVVCSGVGKGHGEERVLIAQASMLEEHTVGEAVGKRVVETSY